MLIKENEETRKVEIGDLKRQMEQQTESETALKKTIQDLETEICDKNKVFLSHIFRSAYHLSCLPVFVSIPHS
jgi:cell division protein FtsB